MKATELRIGNYVDILSNKKRHNERHLLIETIDSFEVNTDFRGYEVADLIPIQLTEEILLKCKGVKSSYTSNPELIGASKKYDLGSIIIFQPNEDESVFYTCINEYMDNLIVDALHQLQNLYFALTGQELEINL